MYNAITYWRRSHTAKEFFDLVRNAFENWNQFKTLLKFPDEEASTDVVYGLVAAIFIKLGIRLLFLSNIAKYF